MDHHGRRERLGPGSLVLVVGPSGAGKDSLIGYARERLTGDPRFFFVQRVITRPVGQDAEAHAPTTTAEFQTMLAAGRFALHWRAHGLCYGLPCDFHQAIRAGGAAVANVSRGVIATASRHYADVFAVQVTSPPAILSERLARRGREAPPAIKARLSRPSVPLDAIDGTLIVNDGPLERAGEEFIRVLRQRARPPSPLA